MKRLLIAIFLLVSTVSNSQSFKVSSLIESTNKSGEVKGLIIDNEAGNEPLIFANITVKETLDTATSELDGSYAFSLKPGIYTLEISFIGYETIEVKKVIVESNKATICNANLSALSLETTLVASEFH